MNAAAQHPEPRPGDRVLDPATGRVGVLGAVYPTSQLIFEHRWRKDRVAFLRPERGGAEWMADPDALRPAADGPSAPD